MKQTLGQRPAGTALMAAFTLVALFVALDTPLFGTLLMALAGLPAVFVSLAWGAPWFALYGGLTIAGTAAYGGSAAAFLFVPSLLLPAGLLAYAISSGIPGLKAIGLSLAGATLFSFGLWTVAPLFGDAGIRIWQLRSVFEHQATIVEGQIRKLNAQNASAKTAESPDSAAKNAEKQASPLAAVASAQSGSPLPVAVATGSGESAESAEATEIVMQQFREWMEFVALLVPLTFLFVWHLISLSIMYLGMIMLAPKHGLSVQPLPVFSSWRFSWQLVWLFLAGWLLYNGADNIASGELRHLARVIGANFLAISKILYFIIGMSLLFYFFEKNEISTPNRFGLSVLALLMTQLLIWAGIADVWLDFRAPPTQKVNRDDDESSFFDQF